MRKIILILLLILLIPFFIITIKDIDREEVNPSLDLTLIETHNSIIELNDHTLIEVFEDGVKNNNPYLDTNVSDWATSNSSNTWIMGGYLRNQPSGTVNSGVAYVPQISILDNEVFYFIAMAKINVLQATSLRLLPTSFDETYVYISNPIINEWYLLSGKFTSNITSTRIPFGIAQYYADTSDALNSNMEVDFALGISMTSLGISSLTVEQMDYWYNVYTTYSPSYDTIQFGTATAGDYLLLQQLIIDNASKDFKLYRDDVIDEVHYTMTQNIDNISVSDVNGNELFILYSDDTYISRVSLSDTTTLSFVGYNITGYIDGDFNNTVLAFFWIVPILLVGALFFIIFKGKESE